MTDEPTKLNLLPRPRRFELTDGLVESFGEPESRIDPQAIPHPQGYCLDLQRHSLTVTAHDPAGRFYAERTLAQLRTLPSVPCGVIHDWPDIPLRGVMLDISRDRVPTMATLFRLVDELAALKINHLQLYTEHTFAYAGHETVWADASPITPDEVRALDAYCRDRFIELTPNQNSLGHMERWLKHPAYASLAETPNANSPPTTLCPGDPGSLALVADLYRQLLPNFTSTLFNVGGDEPVELQQATGRSRPDIERLGLGPVYLDYLLKLHAETTKHGKTMVCWSDILQNHPDLIPQLPKDLIVAEWGYEWDHAFEPRCDRLVDAGLPFYVCPGTSSWLSLVGRTPNMLANLDHAAHAAVSTGASGYLITDWGDRGHPQPYAVSLPAYACGAALSWAYQANSRLTLPGPLCRALDRHVLQARNPGAAAALLELGRAHIPLECTGRYVPPNSTPIGRLLTQPDLDLSPYRPEYFAGSAAYVRDAAGRFADTSLDRDDADLIHHEVAYAADLAILSCDLARTQLDHGVTRADQLPAKALAPLRDRLSDILPRYRNAWLVRSRPGGLPDSIAQLSRALTESDPPCPASTPTA
ncbi:MAG: family 20 glycosylhydrolase [Planctomycetota bacterium]